MTHIELDALINLIQSIVHERLNPDDCLASHGVDRAEERLCELIEDSDDDNTTQNSL